MEKIKNTKDSKFILLGRTGSGKSAIIKYLEDTSKDAKVKRIEYESLCLQYLKDNNTLSKINDKKKYGMDILYKYLWKHVFIIEIFRIFASENSISFLDRLVNNKKKNVISMVKIYLEEYCSDNEIFKSTEETLKNVIHKLETSNSDDLSFTLGNKNIEASMKDSNKKNNFTQIEKVSNETENLIDPSQISKLNNVIELLVNQFKDEKKKYFFVIDDLDRNWNFDDQKINDILKYFIESIKDINSKFKELNIKIVLSIRENIFHGIIKKTAYKDPQTEKWKDYILKIDWKNENLENLVDERLKIFKHQYKNENPSLEQILPESMGTKSHKYNHNEKTFEYILDRTFKRPRDVITFFNLIFESVNENIQKLTENQIHECFKGYENILYQSIIEEWYHNFPFLEESKFIMKNMKKKFSIDEIDDARIEQFIERIMERISNKKDDSIHIELDKIGNIYAHEKKYLEVIKIKVIECWFVIGFIDLDKNLKMSFPFRKLPENITSDDKFIIHKSLYNIMNLMN